MRVSIRQTNTRQIHLTGNGLLDSHDCFAPVLDTSTFHLYVNLFHTSSLEMNSFKLSCMSVFFSSRHKLDMFWHIYPKHDYWLGQVCVIQGSDGQWTPVVWEWCTMDMGCIHHLQSPKDSFHILVHVIWRCDGYTNAKLVIARINSSWSSTPWMAIPLMLYHAELLMHVWSLQSLQWEAKMSPAVDSTIYRVLRPLIPSVNLPSISVWAQISSLSEQRGREFDIVPFTSLGLALLETE